MITDERGRGILNASGAAIGLSLIGLLGFALWALIFREVPEANQNAMTLLIGILSANVGMVVGFYFGSSATTKKQSDTIDVMAKTAATAGVALGVPESALLIPTGAQATATSTPDGTIIEKEPMA